MRVSLCPATDPDLGRLISDQQRELTQLEGEGFVAFALHEGIEYVVARVDGAAVACGGLQALEPGVGEIKRMYVIPEHRGQGYARAVLSAIEDHARARGVHTLRLETGRFLPAALGLYHAAGYAEIPLFGQYIGHPTSVCLEKQLTRAVEN